MSPGNRRRERRSRVRRNQGEHRNKVRKWMERAREEMWRWRTAPPVRRSLQRLLLAGKQNKNAAASAEENLLHAGRVTLSAHTPNSAAATSQSQTAAKAVPASSLHRTL